MLNGDNRITSFHNYQSTQGSRYASKNVTRNYNRAILFYCLHDCEEIIAQIAVVMQLYACKSRNFSAKFPRGNCITSNQFHFILDLFPAMLEFARSLRPERVVESSVIRARYMCEAAKAIELIPELVFPAIVRLIRN